MPDPLPPGVQIEQTWLVEATYAPDAAETRPAFRAEHFAGVAERLRAGTYLVVGAYLDVSSSLLVVRAGSEAEAIDLCRDDVYLRNGVWAELRARPFGLARLVDGAPPAGTAAAESASGTATPG